MRKRIIALLTAFALCLSVASCNKSSNGTQSNQSQSSDSGIPTTNLSIAYASSIGSTNDVVMNYFAEAIAEASDNKISVKLYPSGQLGSDSQVFQEVVNGNVSIEASSTSAYVNAIPELSVFDLFCAYKNIATCAALCQDEEYFETIDSWFQAKGLKLLFIQPIGFRYLTTKDWPINSYEDFEGLSIRTMENANHMNFWNGIGANATPLASSDVYMSLQQGLIKAQETATSGIISSAYYEQCNYLIKTSHLAQVFAVCMNLDQWNSLGEKGQIAMQTAIDDTVAYEREYVQSQDEKDVETLKGYGMTYLEVDDETFEKMKESAQKSVWATIAETIGQDKVDNFLNYIEKHQS